MVPTKFCEVLLVRKLQITCFSVLVTSLLVRSVVLTLQGFSSFSLVVLNLWSHLLWASYDQQFAFQENDSRSETERCSQCNFRPSWNHRWKWSRFQKSLLVLPNRLFKNNSIASEMLINTNLVHQKLLS